MTKTRLFLALSLAAVSRVASAQPGAVEPGTVQPAAGAAPAGEADPPGFVVIDRLDASSRIGIDLSYIAVKGDGTTLLRAELSARYVDPTTALGGYVQVPFAFARLSRGNTGDTGDTMTDLGNVEIGGIYAPRLAAADLRLILHAGITLPTGEAYPESIVGTVANAARLGEFFNSAPEAMTLKLGVSPVLRRGVFFTRINLGFDRNLEVKSGTVPDVIHVAAGAGVDLGRAAVMLEWATMVALDERFDNGTRFEGFTLNQLAVSARWRGPVSPFAAVVVPMDDDLRDLVKVTLTAGAEFAF